MSSESSVNCVCELCLPKGALGPVELVTDDWEANNNNNNKLTELKKKNGKRKFVFVDKSYLGNLALEESVDEQVA